MWKNKNELQGDANTSLIWLKLRIFSGDISTLIDFAGLRR
jgi:hypothetical protein